MAKLIITIDGPAASGKSTVAKLLAEKLQAGFLDTGAMYRAVTLAAMQQKAGMANTAELLDVLKKNKFEFVAAGGQMTVSINGIDAAEEIRKKEVTENVKYIASKPELREKLVEMQRAIANDCEKIVTEGRDQGTVAFPKADIKFFLTAKPAERAKRRFVELIAKDNSQSEEIKLEQIQKAIEQRDKNDENRAAGPLKPARNAIKIDTTGLGIEEVVQKLFDCIENKNKPKSKPPTMRWFRFARGLCNIFCNLFFRISVYGRENVPKTGAVLLVSNHQSYLDPVLCGIPLQRPSHFLARDTLFTNPFLGRLISSVNTMPVKRGKSDLAAMKMVIGKLKQAQMVCLFPEATRSVDGKISQFKPGFGLLCRRGRAAVVPVAIDGAFEAWPRHKKIFSIGKKITISYGKAITAEDVKNMDDKELADDLTQTLRRMQNDSRAKQGKPPYEY